MSLKAKKKAMTLAHVSTDKYRSFEPITIKASQTHSDEGMYKPSSQKSPTSVLSNITIPKQADTKRRHHSQHSDSNESKEGDGEAEETGLMTRKQLYNPFDSDEEERLEAELSSAISTSRKISKEASTSKTKSSPSSILSMSPGQIESSRYSSDKRTTNAGVVKKEVGNNTNVDNKTLNDVRHGEGSKNNTSNKGMAMDSGDVNSIKNSSACELSPVSPSKKSPPKPTQYSYSGENVWVKQSDSSSSATKPSSPIRRTRPIITSNIQR